VTTRIDIGHDHWIRPYSGHGDPTNTTIGFIVEHFRPDDGAPCMGSVLFATADPRYRTRRTDGTLSHVWNVLRPGPEWTLDPSLACGACSDHGWIRDGQWVPA
jgi:hypothetical protein